MIDKNWTIGIRGQKRKTPLIRVSDNLINTIFYGANFTIMNQVPKEISLLETINFNSFVKNMKDETFSQNV